NAAAYEIGIAEEAARQCPPQRGGKCAIGVIRAVERIESAGLQKTRRDLALLLDRNPRSQFSAPRCAGVISNDETPPRSMAGQLRGGAELRRNDPMPRGLAQD